MFQGDRFRLVRADEAGFPAFYRVVWNDHVPEFSDLEGSDRALCMDAVVSVESALREHLRPDKVNLAALGNVVPHLHWHVIARFAWDSHFPSPVWAQAQRTPDAGRLDDLKRRLPDLEKSMCDALGSGRGNCTAS